MQTAKFAAVSANFASSSSLFVDGTPLRVRSKEFRLREFTKIKSIKKIIVQTSFPFTLADGTPAD